MPSQVLISRYLKILLDIDVLFCYNIHMEKIKSKAWTNRKVDLLKRYYGVINIQKLSKMLEHTDSAIRSKVYSLRKRGWTFDTTRR